MLGNGVWYVSTWAGAECQEGSIFACAPGKLSVPLAGSWQTRPEAPQHLSCPSPATIAPARSSASANTTHGRPTPLQEAIELSLALEESRTLSELTELPPEVGGSDFGAFGG